MILERILKNGGIGWTLILGRDDGVSLLKNCKK